MKNWSSARCITNQIHSRGKTQCLGWAADRSTFHRPSRSIVEGCWPHSEERSFIHVDVMSLFSSNEGHCRVTLVTERMITFSDPAGNMSKANNLLRAETTR